MKHLHMKPRAVFAVTLMVVAVLFVVMLVAFFGTDGPSTGNLLLNRL